MYDFRLVVELPNGKRVGAAFRVDSVMARHFEPVDVCTDNLTALAVGGKTVQQVERIKVDRVGLAKDISQQLTEAILLVLEKQDTVNGYQQGGQP